MVELKYDEDKLFSDCMKNSKCKLLAEVGYYEARNQPEVGIAAVMHVALNRRDSGLFRENTLHKVVYKPKQFSYTTDGSMKRGFAEKATYKKVAVIAKRVLTKQYPDPTLGADHYHTLAIKPKWDWQKLVTTVVIGDHIFYRHKES